MGSIYKRGKNWYIDVRVKGRRIRKRVGRSKEIATLALKDAEVKAAREEFGFAKADISIDKFVERFLDYISVNQNALEARVLPARGSWTNSEPSLVRWKSQSIGRSVLFGIDFLPLPAHLAANSSYELQSLKSQ